MICLKKATEEYKAMVFVGNMLQYRNSIRELRLELVWRLVYLFTVRRPPLLKSKMQGL